MSDLDKAREALTDCWREYRRHVFEPTAPIPHVGDFPAAIEALVRAIIADHEEQQLHEAMHGLIDDPLPKEGGAETLACRGAEAARLRKAVEEAKKVLDGIRYYDDTQSADDRAQLVGTTKVILTAALQPEPGKG